MRVREVMSEKPICCRATDSLAHAAWRMWEGDCGALPVVDTEGRAVGMITDRDIAIGVMTKNKAPSEISVAEVITGVLHACAPQDELDLALKTMAAEQVRRLPVLDPERRVVGILSISNLILRAGSGIKARPLKDQILAVLQQICERRQPDADTVRT